MHCTIRELELEPWRLELPAIRSMDSDTILKDAYARQIVGVSQLLHL